MAVATPRSDGWQCARIIEKRSFPEIEAHGIVAFHHEILALVPGLAAGIAAMASLDDVKPLSIARDRFPLLRRILGFGRQTVQSPLAKEFS